MEILSNYQHKKFIDSNEIVHSIFDLFFSFFPAIDVISKAELRSNSHNLNEQSISCRIKILHPKIDYDFSLEFEYLKGMGKIQGLLDETFLEADLILDYNSNNCSIKFELGEKPLANITHLVITNPSQIEMSSEFLKAEVNYLWKKYIASLIHTSFLKMINHIAENVDCRKFREYPKFLAKKKDE